MSTTLKVNEKNDYGSLELPYKHSEGESIENMVQFNIYEKSYLYNKTTSYGEQKAST